MTLRDYQIFCDFDGTITKNDTLNSYLTKYAPEEWINIEKKWQNGKIGSKECLEKQLDLFLNVEESNIKNFCLNVEIDETFINFYNFTKENKIKFTIVSDGFDLFIKNVLDKYNLSEIEYYSNKLIIRNNKFSPCFPYYSKNCNRKSGVCKCSVVQKKSLENKKIIYIGDGLSDICVLDKIKNIFAKNTLARYCDKEGIKYKSFSHFCEIKEEIESERV